jgi:hypothetical protein
MKELESKMEQMKATHIEVRFNAQSKQARLSYPAQLDGEVHHLLHRLREENATLRAHVQRLDPSIYYELPPPVAVPHDLLTAPAHVENDVASPNGASLPQRGLHVHALLPSNPSAASSPALAPTTSAVGTFPHGSSSLDALVSALGEQAHVPGQHHLLSQPAPKPFAMPKPGQSQISPHISGEGSS